MSNNAELLNSIKDYLNRGHDGQAQVLAESLDQSVPTYRWLTGLIRRNELAKAQKMVWALCAGSDTDPMGQRVEVAGEPGSIIRVERDALGTVIQFTFLPDAAGKSAVHVTPDLVMFCTMAEM
jgi:hypothetical protein